MQCMVCTKQLRLPLRVSVPPISVSETSSLGKNGRNPSIITLELQVFPNSDQKQKCATLRHFAGADVQEIFETLPDTEEDYKTALEKLNELFNPTKNIAFERHVFKQATQSAKESVDSFVIRLKL